VQVCTCARFKSEASQPSLDSADKGDSEVKAHGEGKEVAVLPSILLLTETYSLLYDSCYVRKLNTSFVQDPSPDKICCGGYK
jgi:hypothetical protein